MDKRILGIGALVVLAMIALLVWFQWGAHVELTGQLRDVRAFRQKLDDLGPFPRLWQDAEADMAHDALLGGYFGEIVGWRQRLGQ